MPIPVILNADVDSEAGTIVATLQHWMKISGRDVVVVGDPIPDHEGVMAPPGSLWQRINGLPVCRAGDPTTCEHTAVPSQFWWLIS